MRAALLVLALLLLPGCFGGDPPSGWRVFSAADDGCECARTVARSDPQAFDLSYTGTGFRGGLKAYYERDLPLETPLTMTFRGEPNASLSAELRLVYGAVEDPVRCASGGEPRAVHDARYDLDVTPAPHGCAFRLVLHQPIPAGNGIRLVWSAYSFSGEATEPSTPASPAPSANSTTPTFPTVATPSSPQYPAPITFEARRG